LRVGENKDEITLQTKREKTNIIQENVLATYKVERVLV
jgi:hypothetical protein